MIVSIVLSLLMKSVVSLMYIGELITKSFSSCSATSAIRSVGVFVPLTIVLNGVPSLCSFGFPLSFPFFGYFGMRYFWRSLFITPSLYILFTNFLTVFVAVSVRSSGISSYDPLSVIGHDWAMKKKTYPLRFWRGQAVKIKYSDLSVTKSGLNIRNRIPSRMQC